MFFFHFLVIYLSLDLKLLFELAEKDDYIYIWLVLGIYALPGLLGKKNFLAFGN